MALEIARSLQTYALLDVETLQSNVLQVNT